jgi:mRNA-degrading endonuclease RelE of RelBE toxin-antitoxin system
VISKKIEEIRLNPHHYKNLRKPLNHLRRVHIDKSFVLAFSIKESKKLVIIEEYDHHDKIYK